MNREALRRRVRVLAQDLNDPPLWADEDVNDWLEDAQREAAIRARLLRATPAANPDLCQFAVTASVAAVQLPASVYEISYASWDHAKLPVVSREWLDTERADWRQLPNDEPQYIIQDGQQLQLVPAPGIDGTLRIEGYRLPTPMAEDADEPDIPQVHHRHLIQWALHIGYSIPDADLFNPEKSARAEDEFTRYFGPRPDADLRASTRHDEPQRIVAHW